MSLFFYLFTLVINLWHQKFATTVFVNNQHDTQVHSEEVDRRICQEKLDKAWC